MAPKKKATTTTMTARPQNITTLAFVALAILQMLGTYFIRIEPMLTPFIDKFWHLLFTSQLQDGSALQRVYTGVYPVDFLLAGFVVVFWGGPSEDDYSNDAGVRLQRFYFFMVFSAVCAMMNVEAYRARNRGGWLGK
jgi:hypothetical protein